MLRRDRPVLVADGDHQGAAAAAMHISLGRVLDAARERRATLTPEVAGYVILLAARQLGAEPSRVSASTVLLDEAGDVHVERGPAASQLEVELALRGLLAASIALCSSPPPAIIAVAERDASGDLRALLAELSAALIPINHSAAHRALARLYREARRVVSQLPVSAVPFDVARSSEPAPSPEELDIDVMIEPEAAGGPAELGVASSAQDERVAADESVDHRTPSRGAPWLDRPSFEPPRTLVRSDLQQLLRAFLPEARSPEPMLRTLRDMIALELRAPEARGDAAGVAAVPR